MKKTIYGGLVENPAAYCNLHHGSMTVKEIRKRECLKKQCWHLQKNEEHEYWRQRAVQKAKKVNSKHQNSVIY